jgi:hypothetical protein
MPLLWLLVANAGMKLTLFRMRTFLGSCQAFCYTNHMSKKAAAKDHLNTNKEGGAKDRICQETGKR